MTHDRWFCRDDGEWTALTQRLKQTPCPHCQVVGTLNRHGCLFGFDDQNPRQKTLRARRVFCSNRQARTGCGRTFSVWCADKIRRLSLTTGCLWRFLQLAVAGSLAAAVRGAHCHLSDRSWQRSLATIQPGPIQTPHSTVHALPATAATRRCPAPDRGTRPRSSACRLSSGRLPDHHLPTYAADLLHLGRFSGLFRSFPIPPQAVPCR